MTVLDLMQFCTSNNIRMDKADIVIADRETEDDFTAASFSIWNGEQVILYKENFDEDNNA